MFYDRMTFIVAIFALSACANSGTDDTTEPVAAESQTLSIASELVTPQEDGTFDGNFAEDGQTIAGMRGVAGGNGYAYQLGETTSGDYAVIGGILPTTSVIPAPTVGEITYQADYNVVSLENIRERDGELHAYGGVSVNGEITLVADFDSSTITGFDGGLDDSSPLQINGTLGENGTMSGDVSFRGTPGELSGLAGSDAVVAAFAGSAEDTIYAGGLIGTADTTADIAD